MAQKMNSSPLSNLVSLNFLILFFHVLLYKLMLTLLFGFSGFMALLIFLLLTVQKFTIDRVNKSGAIFDSTKLRYTQFLAKLM